MLNPDTYFESLYKNTSKEQVILSNIIEHQKQLSLKLKECLGDYPEKSSDFKTIILEKKEFPDYIRERVVFQSAEDLSVPVYILTPKKSDVESYPTVLALHGHGYGNREIVGLKADGTEDKEEPGIHQHFAIQLVKRGLKVFAPEILGFGDRMLTNERNDGKPSSCYTMATHLLICGKTLAGVRVFEALRTIDFLQLFDDVDKNRIGLMGFSGGGLIGAYASALDERIKATVLCGFTNTFKGSILAMDHCLDNYLPGILKHGELPELIGLIAPRKLFIESGTKDHFFPVETTKEAILRLEGMYECFQANNQFSYDIFEGKHEISGRQSYDWLKSALQKD